MPEPAASSLDLASSIEARRTFQFASPRPAIILAANKQEIAIFKRQIPGSQIQTGFSLYIWTLENNCKKSIDILKSAYSSEDTNTKILRPFLFLNVSLIPVPYFQDKDWVWPKNLILPKTRV